jgi:hypothetical protein
MEDGAPEPTRKADKKKPRNQTTFFEAFQRGLLADRHQNRLTYYKLQMRRL